MGLLDKLNPISAAEKAARAAARAARAAARATEAAAKAAAKAAEKAAKEAEKAAKAAANETKKGINSAAHLSVDTVNAAANVTQDLARGDFNAIAEEGEKLALSAIKEGIPPLQAVAKLSNGVTGEIEKQINTVLSPINLKLNDFKGPINKITKELTGVANYLITTVLNEVLKILLLKKAKDEISKKSQLIGDVLSFYQNSKLLPEEFYDYLKSSGLADLSGYTKGGKLADFPFAKHLGSSFSIGYDLDVAANGLAVDVSPAFAVDTKGKAKGIFSYGAGISKPGASHGIQFSYWKNNTDDLEGYYWSITFAGPSVGINHLGGSISVALNLLDFKFQGLSFQISSAAKLNAKLFNPSIVVGSTKYIH